MGRTLAFAWTVTSGFDDIVDTLAVELNPDDRHRSPLERRVGTR